MKEAGPKRKRDEDTEDGGLARPYSVDDFTNYLRDDNTMDWDQVLNSFRFDIRVLDPKEKSDIIPHATEPLSFKSDADVSLDVDFVIQPTKVWKSMNRYKKFTSKFAFTAERRSLDNALKVPATVEQSTFQVMDHVLVSYEQNHVDKGEWFYGSTWPAKILMVMAGNESHVYLLVNRFFRPEDIEPRMIKGRSRASGRRPYNGRNEIIASNWLEVVHASELPTLY